MKIRNVISIVLLVLTLSLVVMNTLNIISVVQEYNILKDMPNTSGVDWLSVHIGIGIFYFLSMVIGVLTFITFLLSKGKYLKIISCVFFLTVIISAFVALMCVNL